MAENTFNIKEKWKFELNVFTEDRTWRTCTWRAITVLTAVCGRNLIGRFSRTPLVTSPHDRKPVFWDCPQLWRHWCKKVRFKNDCWSAGSNYRIASECSKKHNFIFFLLIAGNVFTMSWNKPPPPNRSQWIHRLNGVMEHMTSKL